MHTISLFGNRENYGLLDQNCPMDNLQARTVDHMAALRWYGGEGAESYVIYRKVKDGKLEYMYVVDKNVTKWTDIKPGKNEIYFYFVVPLITVEGERRINLPKPYTYAIIPEWHPF